MHIVFLQSSLWLSGGARVVVEYANRLHLRGHSVTIVIPKGTLSTELANVILPDVKICEAKVPLVKPMRTLDNIRLIVSMVKVVPKCDILITTHTPTSVVTFLASFLFHKGIPVWFYMDYPGMFSNRPVELWLLKTAVRWHKAELVLSSFSSRELLSYFPNARVFWVGLGLSDADQYRPDTSNAHISNEKKAILYLGDFRPRKGLADFLKATEMVYSNQHDIELWIVSKETGTVETSVPYRFFLHPEVTELSQLYKNCDLFVSSSWFEGFGVPPLEAMACGAPVVMTDSGGVEDYARSGENCLLVPIQSPGKLAEAIQTVLNSSELAGKFRWNGPITAAEFTWEKAVDRFEAALVKISEE